MPPAEVVVTATLVVNFVLAYVLGIVLGVRVENVWARVVGVALVVVAAFLLAILLAFEAFDLSTPMRVSAIGGSFWVSLVAVILGIRYGRKKPKDSDTTKGAEPDV